MNAFRRQTVEAHANRLCANASLSLPWFRGLRFLAIFLMSIGGAHAAKPGAGTSDPCTASNLDFPAFAYGKPSGKTWNIYVTDSLARCSRVIATMNTGTALPRFSYPVDGIINKGRVAWRQGSVIYAVDFTVGGGNTLSNVVRRTLYSNAGCCALDLSKDGGTIYYSDTDTSLARFLVAAPASPVRIYTLPPEDSSWFFQIASVNGDETQLFATKSGFGEHAGGSQLVRIDITSGTEHRLREWLPHDGYGSNPFWPSADKTQARIAFNEYNQDTSNCSPLTVTDYDGNELFPGAFTVERFGRDPTWVGNDVVMLRRTSMDGRGKCGSTSSISMVELGTNVESVLITGYSPDGR